MNWLLISALGFAAWVSVLVLLVAMCRAAARGDEIATATSGGHASAIDLRGVHGGRSASPRRRYLSRRESRRSLSSLPSVWQVGQ
jgi:hypothetical protein